MPRDGRRDPFTQSTGTATLCPFTTAAAEPVTDLITGILTPGPAAVPALTRPGRSGARRTPIRPAEKSRKLRMMSITFSDPSIPERIRALAEQWDLRCPDGRSPNTSLVIEHLLLPQLEAAEQGEIEPPVAGQEGADDAPRRIPRRSDGIPTDRKNRPL